MAIVLVVMISFIWKQLFCCQITRCHELQYKQKWILSCCLWRGEQYNYEKFNRSFINSLNTYVDCILLESILKLRLENVQMWQNICDITCISNWMSSFQRVWKNIWIYNTFIWYTKINCRRPHLIKILNWFWPYLVCETTYIRYFIEM